MSSPARGFLEIFDATTIPGLTEQLHIWGANMETTTTDLASNVEAALRQQNTQFEKLVYDFKSTFMTQSADLENFKNGVIQVELRTDRMEQLSGKAVGELDAIMQAFRAELVQSRAERAADGEALKVELRQLVAAVQAKFQELEGSIGNLAATAAAAATAGPSKDENVKAAMSTLLARVFSLETALSARPASAPRQDDPWQRSQTQQPWSGGAGAAQRSSSEGRAAQEGIPCVALPPSRTAPQAFAMDTPPRSWPPAPGIPPGIPEPQPASQPSWQQSYNTTTGWQNWNGWQSQGHVSEFRVDTRVGKASNSTSRPNQLDLKLGNAAHSCT